MSYLDEAAQDMAESFKRIFITAFGHGYDFGCESKEGELKRLRADNAKLRELVRHLYEYRQLYFKTGIYPTDHGVTERRMHELGAEVDE